MDTFTGELADTTEVADILAAIGDKPIDTPMSCPDVDALVSVLHGRGDAIGAIELLRSHLAICPISIGHNLSAEVSASGYVKG